MKTWRAAVLMIWVVVFMSEHLIAQNTEANYDEAKVPAYDLPALLTAADGKPLPNEQQWQQRRLEILELFRQHVYGVAEQEENEPIQVSFEEIESGPLGTFARRKQIKIVFRRRDRQHEIDLLVYLPAAATQSVPVFLGLNFQGNHTIAADPAIRLTPSWVRASATDTGLHESDSGALANRAREADRGIAASRWPVEAILQQGFALATVYYGDIDPDFDDRFRNGIHQLYDTNEIDVTKTSSIAWWSWGLSRALDYLASQPQSFNANQVVVFGHSRLGKTALWAGANDDRFAITISNNSGCGGAALHRRSFGETVASINQAFPHWFCAKFSQYDHNEAQCPVDQHMLIALMAPRPVYVASASEDLWADPHGEFLAAKFASPAYQVYGLTGLANDTPPDLDRSVGDRIGYHRRSGKHDITAADWEHYLRFAKRHLSR